MPPEAVQPRGGGGQFAVDYFPRWEKETAHRNPERRGLLGQPPSAAKRYPAAGTSSRTKHTIIPFQAGTGARVHTHLEQSFTVQLKGLSSQSERGQKIISFGRFPYTNEPLKGFCDNPLHQQKLFAKNYFSDVQ